MSKAAVVDYKKNGRDTRIDILRAIAIIAIIIAHSGVNPLVAQIRNFDVILMTLLLGLSFRMSIKKKKIDYIDYVKKRFKRLIIPTWLFLTFFFLLYYVIKLIRGDQYYFNMRVIIGSYTLLDGIGYIWIMRVFFIVALVNPLLIAVSNKIKNNIVYFLLISVAYILYSIMVKFGYLYLNGTIFKLYSEIFLCGMAYSLVAAIGLRLIDLRQIDIFKLAILSAIALLALAIYYNFAYTQPFKYPPRLYYISYGLFVSFLLYWMIGFPKIKKVFENKFIMFLSENSIWLYFWHIIYVYVIILFGNNYKLLANHSIVRFCFIFLLAFLSTYLHSLIKKKVNEHLPIAKT